MALPDKQPSPDIDRSLVIEFVPQPPALPARSAVEEMEDARAGRGFLAGKSRSFGRLCGEARRAAVEGTAEVAFRLRTMRSRPEMRVRSLKQRVGSLKQEDPLRLLGMITAAAFVCGIIARIWRSESDESRRK